MKSVAEAYIFGLICIIGKQVRVLHDLVTVIEERDTIVTGVTREGVSGVDTKVRRPAGFGT